MNGSGVRTDLVPGPDGNIRYGQIFEMQPFGNNLVVMSLTGDQIRRMLEQQFAAESYAAGARPALMVPSQGFAFDFDLSRPEGPADRPRFAERQAARSGRHLPRHRQQFPRQRRRRLSPC